MKNKYFFAGLSMALLVGIGGNSLVYRANAATCSVATAMSDTVSNPTPSVGDVITYTLTGAPVFTAPTQITVTDQLGAGLTFVSATPAPGAYASSTGVWDVGTLNGASVITLAIMAKVDPGTEGQTIVNAPAITYVQSNCTQSSAADTATITVQGATPTPTSTPPTPSSTPLVADLAIAKIADVATTTPGSTVHYTLTVTNFGPASSTGIVATDTLPGGLTLVSASPSQGAFASGTWTIGSLNPNATATLALAALVNASTSGQTITNLATVAANASTTDNNLANNTASVSIAVVSMAPTSTPTSTPSSTPVADIGITKSVDHSSPHEGDTIHYTLTVAAFGPATSTGVVATD